MSNEAQKNIIHRLRLQKQEMLAQEQYQCGEYEAARVRTDLFPPGNSEVGRAMLRGERIEYVVGPTVHPVTEWKPTRSEEVFKWVEAWADNDRLPKVNWHAEEQFPEEKKDPSAALNYSTEVALFKYLYGKYGRFCLRNPSLGSVWASKDYSPYIVLTEKDYEYEGKVRAIVDTAKRKMTAPPAGFQGITYGGSNGKDLDVPFFSLMPNPESKNFPGTDYTITHDSVKRQVEMYYLRKGEWRSTFLPFEPHYKVYSSLQTMDLLGLAYDSFLLISSEELSLDTRCPTYPFLFIQDYPDKYEYYGEKIVRCDQEFCYDVEGPGTYLSRRRELRVIAHAMNRQIAPLSEQGIWGVGLQSYRPEKIFVSSCGGICSRKQKITSVQFSDTGGHGAILYCPSEPSNQTSLPTGRIINCGYYNSVVTVRTSDRIVYPAFFFPNYRSFERNSVSLLFLVWGRHSTNSYQTDHSFSYQIVQKDALSKIIAKLPGTVDSLSVDLVTEKKVLSDVLLSREDILLPTPMGVFEYISDVGNIVLWDRVCNAVELNRILRDKGEVRCKKADKRDVISIITRLRYLIWSEEKDTDTYIIRVRPKVSVRKKVRYDLLEVGESPSF